MHLQLQLRLPMSGLLLVTRFLRCRATSRGSGQCPIDSAALPTRKRRAQATAAAAEAGRGLAALNAVASHLP